MEYPLISCIMPTRNRRRFVEQAIAYFHRQDYPNKELLVVDDSDLPACELADLHAGVRYLWLSRPLPIGVKRNIACSLAQGELICHWDDDDYYGPQRLALQAASILSGHADVSALRMSLLLDVAAGKLWTCSDDTHRLCFKLDIHYGTLLYRAAYWREGTQFAPVQVGEDRRFVHALLARDARLARVVDPPSYAYVLHRGNTTSDMRLVHADGWQELEPASYLSPEDLAFYRQLGSAAAEVAC